MTTSSKYILDTSREFALYSAMHRAIPFASDGLKDSQRIALWVAKNKDVVKVSALNGAMAESNLYVHGDASGTISLLAAPFLNNVPFFEGHGAFGTRSDTYPNSAPRYVSVKRSKAAEAFLYNDPDILEMVENYDGSNVMPSTFLPIIPTTLLNGISGTAVGWSTDILPHSLSDLIKATIEALDRKPLTKLKPTYSYTKCAIKALEENVWQISGAVEFVDSSTIRVVELPPELPLEKFREKLDILEENRKIQGYTDNSSKEINVLVKFKRGSVQKEFVDSYLDILKLRARKTERIVVIDFNMTGIHQYPNPESFVEAFVEWRFGHYVRRYENLLKVESKDLIFWKGVKACFDYGLLESLTAAGQPIANKKAVVAQIVRVTEMDKLALEDDHIDRIASFPTYRWTKEEYDDVIKKIAELEKNILYYKDLLANPVKIRGIFKSEVKALEKLKV